MEQIISQITGNFDFSFIIAVNVLTYMMIRVSMNINKGKQIKLIWKRVELLGAIMIVTGIYILCGYANKFVLVNSAIACPVAWSWILKPLFKKLGVDYQSIEKIMD